MRPQAGMLGLPQLSSGELYTRPTLTESESLDDDDNSSQQSEDSDNGARLQIATSYLPATPNRSNWTRVSPTAATAAISPNNSMEEDRLIMLAKHPNATEGQVRQALMRQQQIKAAKAQLQEQHQLALSQRRKQVMLAETQPQQQQRPTATPATIHPQEQTRVQIDHTTPQGTSQRVTFSPAYPVDADTGEAWEKVPNYNNNNNNNKSSTSMTVEDTSFDQLWDTESQSQSEASTKKKKAFFASFWHKVLPQPSKGDSSVVSSKQDAPSLSISMTSDKTPKISNVDQRKARKRRRTKTSMGENDDDGDDYKGPCGLFCHRLFRTRQGLVVLALLIVLLLAVIVTIVAALASQRGSESITTNVQGTTDSVVPSSDRSLPPMDARTEVPVASPTTTPNDMPSEFSPVASPTQDTIPTIPIASPVLAPTEAPILPVALPVASPVESPVMPVMVETSLPTTAMPSEEPIFNSPVSDASNPVLPEITSLPTSLPTTIAPSPSPTTPPPTAPAITIPPSNAPTPRPTNLPTRSPTKRPSAAPSNLPTDGPTLGFASTELTSVGTPLLGSQADQRFGQSIALSDNGQIVAIGSPSATINGNAQTGLVEIFERTAGWKRRGSALLGSNPESQFGSTIAMSGDGSVLIVTNVSGALQAFLYTPSTGNYEPMGSNFSASTDQLGVSLAMNSNGTRFVVGSPSHDNGGPNPNISGKVTVFDRQTDNTWLETATITGTDHLDWFGWQVDLTDDGSVLCVGAPRNLEFSGYVQCYTRMETGRWTLLGTTIRNVAEPVRYDDNFGHALQVDRLAGDNLLRVAIGAPGKNGNALDAGAVIVYEYDGDDWKQLGGPLVADAPVDGAQLGFAVGLQEDILVVGSPGLGQVDRYRYAPTRGEWEHHPITLRGANGSSFGYAIAQHSNWLAIGSADTPGANTGMVNVYQG